MKQFTEYTGKNREYLIFLFLTKHCNQKNLRFPVQERARKFRKKCFNKNIGKIYILS